MRQIRFCLLFFICLAGVKTAWAQNDFLHHTIDSLRLELPQKKTPKDSILVLQQMVDAMGVRAGETAFYPDYVKQLLELNKAARVIDPAPYLLIQQGNKYWQDKQYREALKSTQAAIALFDKQHKAILPLLMNMRILYNLTDDQEARLKYYTQKLEYYQVNGPVENTAPCYHAIGGYYLTRGAYNQAINNYFKGAELFRRYSPNLYVNAISVVGNTYIQWGNTDKAGYYLKKVLPLINRIKDTSALGVNDYALSQISVLHHNYKDALEEINVSINLLHVTSQRLAGLIAFKAGIYLAMGKPDLALPVLNKARAMADSGSFKTVSAFGNMEIDYEYYQYYKAIGDAKNAEKNLLTAYKASVDEKGVPLQLKYLKELGEFYRGQNKPDLSGKYFDQYFKVSEAQDKDLDQFKVSQYEIDQNDKEQKEHINTLKQEKVLQDYQISRRNGLLWGSAVVLLLISGLLIFIYRQLSINKKTLISLRQTQRQLIQSEKMASLGELTAGIAHEIQNPLNFVNNFSEVNQEMLEELKAESAKPKAERDERVEVELINDLIENEQKINHHGKRADFIVKGMLQHSRTSTGEKQPTNINILADEFFRLSYHGLRAKDKSFNAELTTHFDEHLPKVNVVQQDMGRVLLNLFNNAFYAVNQKAKTAGADYKPEVSVITLTENSQVIIKVKDNGVGIPDAIKEKILQPFFTTKPTGEGTGLGLSLSYDILVKGHNGTLDIVSKEGEGSIFTITLPS